MNQHKPIVRIKLNKHHPEINMMSFFDRYIEKNVRCHSMYRTYNRNLPAFLLNKPRFFLLCTAWRRSPQQRVSTLQMLRPPALKVYFKQRVKPSRGSGITCSSGTIKGCILHVSALHGSRRAYLASTSFRFLSTIQSGTGRSYHKTTGSHPS